LALILYLQLHKENTLKEYLTLSEIQEDLRGGNLTCVELVDFYLQNIESNQHLNAFVEVYADEAREAAVAVDQKLANGTSGRLAGMVIGLKDVLSHKGHGLQAGSQILNAYVAPFTPPQFSVCWMRMRLSLAVRIAMNLRWDLPMKIHHSGLC